MNEPTQVAYPWRTALRTGVQTIIALAALVLALNADFGEPAALGSAVAVAMVVTRVMSNPAVNAFIVKFLPFLAPEAK